jgi:PAS domain S-box-containing protein
MEDQAANVHALRQRQAAIAAFGGFALRNDDLQTIMAEAARVCAESFGVRFCKVCEYRQAEDDLLVVAGCGWQADVVGHVISRADKTSPQGHSFITGKPWICIDIRKDQPLEVPEFYARHGIISTIDVIIKGDDRPYGVLEIDSTDPRQFDQYDIDFLTAFANVLAESVAATKRNTRLRSAIEELEATVGRVTASEERLRIMIDVAPIALIMSGVDGRIVMANPLAERIFGYPHGELLNQKIDILVPERLRGLDNAVVSELFKEEPSNSAPAEQAFIALRKDGHEFQVEIGSNSGTFRTGRNSRRNSGRLRRWKPLAGSRPASRMISTIFCKH